MPPGVSDEESCAVVSVLLELRALRARAEYADRPSCHATGGMEEVSGWGPGEDAARRSPSGARPLGSARQLETVIPRA